MCLFHRCAFHCAHHDDRADAHLHALRGELARWCFRQWLRWPFRWCVRLEAGASGLQLRRWLRAAWAHAAGVAHVARGLRLRGGLHVFRCVSVQAWPVLRAFQPRRLRCAKYGAHAAHGVHEAHATRGFHAGHCRCAPDGCGHCHCGGRHCAHRALPGRHVRGVNVQRCRHCRTLRWWIRRGQQWVRRVSGRQTTTGNGQISPCWRVRPARPAWAWPRVQAGLQRSARAGWG